MRKARSVMSIVATAAMLTGCATLSKPRDTVARVNPASVAASPARFDGRAVEMVGLLAWDTLALYQDYGT
jgi:PBP1b-binding outer membrane lipoprotein LpoB